MFPGCKALAITLLAACCVAAHATSLQEFYAKSTRDQGLFVSDYILKMKNDLAVKDPELAQAVWVYFVRKQDGKPLSEGGEALLMQELHVDELVKEGKADPAKIQIEGLIVYVVKQKFSPR